jgi:hypothetical protein
VFYGVVTGKLHPRFLLPWNWGVMPVLSRKRTYREVIIELAAGTLKPVLPEIMPWNWVVWPVVLLIPGLVAILAYGEHPLAVFALISAIMAFYGIHRLAGPDFAYRECIRQAVDQSTNRTAQYLAQDSEWKNSVNLPMYLGLAPNRRRWIARKIIEGASARDVTYSQWKWRLEYCSAPWAGKQGSQQPTRWWRVPSHLKSAEIVMITFYFKP